MDKDNNGVKAWGGGGSKAEGVNGGKNGTPITLSTIKLKKKRRANLAH